MKKIKEQLIRKESIVDVLIDLTIKVEASTPDQESNLQELNKIRIILTQYYYDTLRQHKLKIGEPVPPEEFVTPLDFSERYYRNGEHIDEIEKAYGKDQRQFQLPNAFAMDSDCAGGIFFYPHPAIAEKDMRAVLIVHEKYTKELWELYEKYKNAILEYIPDEDETEMT